MIDAVTALEQSVADAEEAQERGCAQMRVDLAEISKDLQTVNKAYNAPTLADAGQDMLAAIFELRHAMLGDGVQDNDIPFAQLPKQRTLSSGPPTAPPSAHTTDARRRRWSDEDCVEF